MVIPHEILQSIKIANIGDDDRRSGCNARSLEQLESQTSCELAAGFSHLNEFVLF